MGIYQVTATEMMWIAQQLEEESIYGIGNPFAGMSQSEVDAELKAAAKSLLAKKYITEDFDGNISVNKDLLSKVRACAEYDFMLSEELIREGKYSQQYFIRHVDSLVSLKAVKDAFELSETSLDEIKSSVKSAVEIDGDYDVKSDIRAEIDLMDLKKIREKIEDGESADAIKALGEMGCDKDIAKIYVDSVEKKLDYTGLIYIFDPVYRTYGDSILYIKADGRLIAVEHDIINDDDFVVFREISKAEIEERAMANLEGFAWEEPDSEASELADDEEA